MGQSKRLPLLAFLATMPLVLGLPSMRDSFTHPVHVYEGDDALITCVVRDVGDNTVMWKKEDRERHSRRVLTAGDARVTGDRRFDVLHDGVAPEELSISGGDVWVLVIRNAMPSDSGIYVCEVNSNPIVRSFHKLSVLTRSQSALEGNATATGVHGASSTGLGAPPEPSGDGTRNHNYTDCCASSNVSAACFGFCNIQSILDGNTGQDPEHCEADFPAIVRCMADGRNHVPCCIRQGVPDICQDVCRGEYTVITDNIKTHFSCSAYTEETLACIVDGVELLPSPPEDVEVEALTENTIRVSWTVPSENADTVTTYVINVTSLRQFDQDPQPPSEDYDLPPAAVTFSATASTADSSTRDSYADAADSYARAAAAEIPFAGEEMTAPPSPHEVSPVQATYSYNVSVPGTYNSTIITGLTPFTMYEINVIARNIHGQSLPSYTIRTLTLTSGKLKQTTVAESPQLPDIKSCCIKKGVSHATCVNKLCDPTLSEIAEVTDLMICAPWATDTFRCLTNGIDHTACCRARGLPVHCQELCSGNITQLDFSYFKCLKYMGDYTNCLLQGYGVLPSAPQRVYISNIATEYAIIHWDPPKILGETVLFYNVKYRRMAVYDNEYHTVSNVHPPFILENLHSDSDYEVFVEAANAHGVGQPSARIVFRTDSQVIEDKIEASTFYNVTACCVAANLSESCLPLCSYDASMSDVRALAGVCGSELHKLLRCGAGGRNHGTCCMRRGVPPVCLPLCAGVVADSLIITATSCIPYIGNIVQCFEEGTGLLPGPINELHATVVTDNSIKLEWEPPSNSTVTGYIVHYQKVDNTSMHETVLKLDNQMNVTSTSAKVTGLESGSIYNFFVVSVNEHGTSLPSSVLMINITNTDVGKEGIPGVTSPPHSLAVSGHSATWVTITWQPPEFSHPTEHIVYRLYHKTPADDVFQMAETTVTSHTLQNLNPNTQYIVYVIAVSKNGQSLPSETLIAWTDPAYPAFVEPPTVHPINLVIEGSSMTILCIAMGTPMPTISLYISGRLVRQEVTRHMVTVVNNVTRDMDQISCYADNGYGTPMQASRKITISHPPQITASGITMAGLGDSVVLECTIDAHPEPKTMFWRDHSGRVPVIQGGKYNINVQPVKDEEDKYIMQLTIHKIGSEDEGDYFCHAENAFGSKTRPVSVRIRNVAASNNVTQCCIEQNVTSSCMVACSFYLDIDAVIDKPECINDFDKLMKCAADGSDHRSCCAQWGVPRRCLDWCRGEPLFNNKFCVLSYTKQIMACFHEDRGRLPGPPQNIQIELVDAHSVLVKWDPPVKNPNTVEMYRVFWKQVGSRTIMKNDTKSNSLLITGLKYGEPYECVIKAGNHLGTSTLTEAKQFTTRDKYISSGSIGGDGSHVGTAVGVVLALIIAAGIVAGAVWFIRTRRMLGNKSTGGVAFENPSYLREVNMDHIQIPQPQADTSMANGNSISNGINPASGAGWKQETLHVPAQQTEVAPSLYEELKLGQDGAGFKRLK
ncbi:Ig-like and fibronectin type-III domain-containing protein 1 isoform X1 [Schistocerca nitens]|uniref:Ig-like and fibronectin type-III domain-containing protein 1 isoform X1 n=1 Tax=Schistocerca nitens TaxID=7011 RepID=UPI0021177051|nr:Ig-like and fibronectin type-III domain-containing protein 1 isoform X1 [Schistocerca nitens]XP_049803085.1 Ig-like and fibronectin type-III domain-containing protein 1 isoform X1 [Schistocerca nitens]XP_049803086.1 Ig-like and fibronectin type-III domain-containing protein 1 isoform X1 [Schistocerca nitens]